MPSNIDSNSERLQKYLARCGIASRRGAEELIRQGRVTVNGQVVSEMGSRVNPNSDLVEVNGQSVKVEGHEYWLVYKPFGHVSTASDTHGRPTVVQLVKSESRLYPVGRLDADSEGLMLLTNDGALAQQLMHPSHAHEKEYMVLVRGRLDREVIDAMRQGMLLAGERTPAVARVWRLPREVTWRGQKVRYGEIWARVVLRQGQKRQIRRMFGAVHCNVRRIIRVRIASLEIGRMAPGDARRLEPEELSSLREVVGL